MQTVFRSRFFLGALIVLAVVVVYIPAMRAGFVWDDDLLLTENPLVRGEGGTGALGSLPYIWASAATTDYTPLTTTAFWLQWRLWGDVAVGYHLVNILLFALSALLLWRVLARLAIPGAWLGALLFALHPVNVASVAWVAELKNALSLPFYLAAIAWFLHFLESRKPAPWLLSVLAAACAMLCKGSTVIVPFVLLLCAWWKERRVTGRQFLALLPFLALSCAAAWVTIHFQARVIDAGVVPVSLTARVARAGEAFWFYLAKDVWPLHLCAVYPKWNIDRTFIPLGLATALGVALWVGRRRLGPGPFFAWAYFLIALLPVLGVLSMTFLDQAYVADWWQQLALPAVTSLAGAALAIAWRRKTARGGVGAGIAVIILLLGARTWSEACGYESMETFCRRALACNPDAWAAHNNLGSVLNSQGRLEEAAAEYREALRLKPSDSSAHSNLGTVYARLRRYDDAISEYHAALQIEPDDAKAWFNLGNALRATHRNDAAIAAFSRAIDLNARWVTARYDLGGILLDLGRADDAGRQAQTIVAIEPGAISGHYLLARSAAAIGRFDVATVEAGAALDIARNVGDAKTINQMQEALDACKAHKPPPAPEP